MSSLKSSKETIEKGNPGGWGQVLDIINKNNQFGIDYHPSSIMPNPKDQKKFYHIHEVFNSVGF